MVTIERLLDHYEREGRRGCGHLCIDLLNEIRFTHSTKRLIISYWYSVSIRKDSKQPLSLFRLTFIDSKPLNYRSRSVVVDNDQIEKHVASHLFR